MTKNEKEVNRIRTELVQLKKELSSDSVPSPYTVARLLQVKQAIKQHNTRINIAVECALLGGVA